MALGTQSLKDALRFLMDAVQKISTVDSDQDGRISLFEGISAFMSLAIKLPGIFTHIPDIKAEWKDLDPEEVKEIARWFAEQFDLPGDDHEALEAIIKRIAAGLVDNYQLYLDIQALRSAAA